MYITYNLTKAQLVDDFQMSPCGHHRRSPVTRKAHKTSRCKAIFPQLFLNKNKSLIPFDISVGEEVKKITGKEYCDPGPFNVL
jgi:hypothetical protein